MTGDNRGRLLDHHRVIGRVLVSVRTHLTMDLVQRLIFFLLFAALLYSFNSKAADAVDMTCSYSASVTKSYCADQGLAYSAAQAVAQDVKNTYYSTDYRFCPAVSAYSLGYEAGVRPCNGVGSISDVRYRLYQASCLSRPDGQPGMINGSLTSTGVCNNGCKMKPNLDPGTDFTLTDKANNNAIIIKRGTWVATGETCHDEPAQPPEKPEYCHTVQGGYTVCKSKDQTCVVTPSGFRTCASDAGNISGQVATNNQRTEAAGISAPNTPANGPSNRPGENWSQTGGQSITNNISNVVTNISNYSNSGTPNGNQPVKGDGSAAGGNTDTGTGGSNGTGSGSGDGSGDGNGKDYGSVTGGGSCDAGFACTGGDPVLCSIAQQQFNARCESESRFGGNASDFPGNSGGDGDDPTQDDVHKSHTFGLGMLDSSGFLGGGSCPDFGSVQVMGVSVDLDADGRFCQIVGVARACILLLGAFIAISIVVGRSEPA